MIEAECWRLHSQPRPRPGQVQFTANGGGFAAVGGNGVVNLAHLGRISVGRSGSFLPSGAVLALGTSAADSMVDFQNPIVLGAGRKRSGRLPAPALRAWPLNYGCPQRSGGLTIAGDGTLLLSGTDNTYSGARWSSLAR